MIDFVGPPATNHIVGKLINRLFIGLDPFLPIFRPVIFTFVGPARSIVGSDVATISQYYWLRRWVVEQPLATVTLRPTVIKYESRVRQNWHHICSCVQRVQGIWYCRQHRAEHICNAMNSILLQLAPTDSIHTRRHNEISCVRQNLHHLFLQYGFHDFS